MVYTLCNFIGKLDYQGPDTNRLKGVEKIIKGKLTIR
jgi:hypothetical protein